MNAEQTTERYQKRLAVAADRQKARETFQAKADAYRASTGTANYSHNPRVAVLLSLLIVGLGHLYAGQVGRGAAWFLGGGLLIIVTAGIALPFVWVGAAIDANNCAKH